MSVKHQLFLSVVFIVAKLLGIDCRCGYPEMPFMSNSIESKDYFEERETLSVSCIGSITVGQTMKDHVIQCQNNTWNTTSLRCSRVHEIKTIDIAIEDNSVNNKNLENQEFLYLSDNDPMTCVLLKDEEKWVLHLGEELYVSNIALIATYVDNKDNTKSFDITVSLPNGRNCRLEETNERPNSVVVFFIYNCEDSQPTENVSIDLKTNKNDINICGIEMFAIITDDCGKPEIPLYSYANQMRIQNGTKIAEYVCAKGYHMIGSPMRTCGSDGLWKPSSPPTCVPDITCDPKLFQPNSEIRDNFTYQRRDFDLFGNAIPEVSNIAYHCINRSELITPRTESYCLPEGNWSEIEYIPVCHPRSSVIVVFGHHFLNDKHLIYYGAAGLTVLFVGSFVILFHMRRLAKKISKQMREKSYFDQEKALPHYNTETNYQDLTNLFVPNEGNASGQAVLPQVQAPGEQKY